MMEIFWRPLYRKSFWYDEENFEGMREDLPQVLADYYQENELDAETLRDLLDTAYESGVFCQYAGNRSPPF